MCGIVGIVHLDHAAAEHASIQRMTDAVAHRGPDGEGHFVEGPVALGHRRLAIIDLSPTGRQPMATEDGRYVLIYNGELYNFRELRVELEALGAQFRSRSDSEVLLKAYAQWGERCLTRFNGMFAFAILDRQRREVFLARDRYGIKPLYYWQNGATLLFGSEVKSFMQQPAFSKRVNLPGLLEYLTFQNFFTDQTLLDGVRLLPAGCFMRVRYEARTVDEPQRYWDFNFAEPETVADPAEYLEELDRLFNQAVSRQLVSDVDVGAYLSGGMDSGSITAIAARQLAHMKSFTCGFDLHSASGLELGYDERRQAEYMSHLSRTEHYQMVLKSGDMERCMPTLTWHLEEPRVGQSYPNFYIARLASKFVKVALSGTGSDELFGGYPWRYYRAVVNDDFEHYVDKYFAFWQRLIPGTAMADIFKPVWSSVSQVSTRDIFRGVFQSHAHELVRPEDYINHSLYFEAKTFLHGLLVVEDKLSMAHSLETRVPFLDNDLVDFAMRVPVALKLGSLDAVVQLNENEPGSKTERYFQKTKDGKLLLRKMMDRYVPASITQAEKQGFSAPDASWFKGESIEYVRRTLYQGQPRLWEFLDKRAVLSLVDEHLEGKQNRRLLVWSLLNLENWCRRFL